MTRLQIAQNAYAAAFRAMPPEPWGIDDDRLAEVIEQAVALGQPIDPDFDWWDYLPPDADA